MPFASIDVVYDPVGMVQKSLKVIAWSGRILVVGFAAGSIERIPMNLVLLKNTSLVGVHWGTYHSERLGSFFKVDVIDHVLVEQLPSRVQEVWKELLDLYAKGVLKPIIYTEVFEYV